jgi:hypothetical protein
MTQFLKKYWDFILLLTITTIIVVLNIRPDYLIIGLDNASPYFNPSIILERIKDTSVMIYGGILFQIPLLSILHNLNIAPKIISNVYVFGNFLLGIFGSFFILKSLTKNKLSAIIGTLVLLSSMFTFWIFSQPNFLFLATYGSIPFLIYFLGKDKHKYYDWIFLIIFSISFLTVSLNLVAFGLYLVQIIILVKILYPKSSWKKLVLWSLTLIIFWLTTLQIVKIINGDTTFILTNIFTYIKDLLNNPFMTTITKDILASEKTNTLLHTLSFSLGWTELHDMHNIPVFAQYGLYRENLLYILMGLIPSLIALATVFLKKDKRNILLTFLFLFFVFISSRYGIWMIENVPYLSSALRWVSSKLWPIYIIPLIVLVSILMDIILNKKENLLKYFVPIVLVVVMGIYSYPVLSGNLLSPKTLVNIPNEYFQLPQGSTILILPEPQKLYMREYNWGYYGSDFISYINNSKIVDASNLYETSYIYQEILRSRVVPKNVEYLVYDKSVRTENQYNDILDGFVLINSNEYFDLYGKE